MRSLPEEPLRNACVGELSVAENMALRDFDQRAAVAAAAWLRFGALARARAREWIAEYGVKTRGENAPIRSLSGGNVQRAVLARELAGEIDVLIAANPVFGLDFAAVRRDPRAASCRCARRGGAVLLISEDLDELLELADRIVVMSEGRIVFETAGRQRRPHDDRRAHGRRRTTPRSRRRATEQPHDRRSHADALRLRVRTAAQTALVIIDMQRDFVEPGGFGAIAGQRRDAAAQRDRADRARCSRPGARAAGRSCTRARRTSPTCPTARRPSALRGDPTLRIGDAGPMGRILIARRAGHRDHPGAGAAAPARS